MKRYEWLAEEMERLIGQGVLRAGDKAPSVRGASSQFGVSKSTVLHAYGILEQRGILEPRPKSGFYICYGKHAQPLEPRRSSPSNFAQRVDINDLIYAMFAAMKDRSVVPFGAAFPDPNLLPLRKFNRLVVRFMRSLDPYIVVRDLPPGDPLLIKQLARRYLQRGYHVPADEIVITSGALEAINLCLNVVTKPGDAVAVECPSMYVYLQAIQRLSLRAVAIPTEANTGLCLDRLEAAIKKHALKAVLVMTNFQNPLGCTMPDATKRQLVELLAKHQIPLIEDDVYAELAFDGKHRKSTKAYDREGLVLHCSSFSKCFAPGYRLGWVAGGRYAAQLEAMKLSTTLSNSPYSQAAVYEYLAHGAPEKDMHQVREVFRTNLRCLSEAIWAEFPDGTRISRPEGGFMLWVELPEWVDVLKLFQQAMSSKISFAPGPMFSTDNKLRNCLRMNFGFPWSAAMQNAVRRIGTLAKQQLY